MPKDESEVIDETQEEGKKKAAAKRRNALAVANLTMAFTTEATICLVYESVTEEWPSGLAHRIVDALFKKYQPQDTMTKVELRQQLNKVSLKKTEDPAKLFEQIAAIQNRYNTATKRIDEEDLIATVLEKAPKEYQALLTGEQLRLADELTIEHLRKAMSTHWRTISDTGTNVGANSDGEIAPVHLVDSVSHVRRKVTRHINAPRKEMIGERRRNSMENAITVAKKGIVLLTVGNVRRTKTSDQRTLNQLGKSMQTQQLGVEQELNCASAV